MKAFSILEHTADVGFEAYGATLQETFRNAGRALTALRVDLETIAPRDTVVLEARGRDRAGLLVNWLNEILYHEDAKDLLLCDFKFSVFEDTVLVSTARGERFDPLHHQLSCLVKAITYHQLSVECHEGVWLARVFVDV
jgi:SHS2 domain-containing protein